MNIVRWKGIVESILFAAGDEGLSLNQIASVLEIDQIQTFEIVQEMRLEYENNQDRGILLMEIGGVIQLTTKKEHAIYLKKLVENTSHSSLSQAALETLAIIAYKQPITKAEIEEIRGVKTERPIQTLVSKVLIQEVGRREGAGRAYLYGTTKEFLDYFGLKSLDELPPLPEKEEEHNFQEEADLFFEKFQETIE